MSNAVFSYQIAVETESYSPWQFPNDREICKVLHVPAGHVPHSEHHITKEVPQLLALLLVVFVQFFARWVSVP